MTLSVQQACKAAGAQLIYMYPDEHGIISEEEMRTKIGPRTKVVSIVHVSNVLGVTNPVKKIGQAAHSVGAIFIVEEMLRRKSLQRFFSNSTDKISPRRKRR